MTTAAGALDILVSADTAQASSSLSKFAADAEREMGRAARATAAAQKDGDRYIAGLQRQVDTFGMTSSEIAKYEARLKGVSSAADPLIDRLSRMKEAQAGFNTAQAGAAGAEGLKAAAHGMEEFGFHTAAAKRELLVLAHELSQGNYKRFGGSLMVLGEQTGAASMLFSGLGIAAIAAGAAIVGVVYEVVKGAEAFDQFNKSLLLTGNFAGLNADTFKALSAQTGHNANTTTGHGAEAAQAAVATGVFGPETIGAASEAIARMSALSGESADKVAADFAKMGDGVAKFAADHDKSMHLLSLSQYEYIKQLEEAGKATEAQGVYLNALNERLREHDREIGEVGKYWQEVKNQVSDYVRMVQGIGTPASVGDRLAGMRAHLSDLERPGRTATVLDMLSGTGSIDKQIADVKAQIAFTEGLQQQNAAVDKANAQARADQDAGKRASDELGKLDAKIKGTNNLTKALEGLKRQEDAIRQAGGVVTDDDHNRRVAELKRENAGPKGHSATKGPDYQAQLDTAFEERMNALGAENAKLDNEISSWEQYGKAVDKSRVAVLMFDIEQGKLKGKGGTELTGAQQFSLWERAYNADLKQAYENELKAAAAADKRTKSIEAGANAQAMNARESRIATEMVEIENSGLTKGTALYEQKAAARAAAVNAEFDAKLKQQLAAEQLANDAEIRKIDEDIKMIGMSRVEREKYTVVLKLQAQAEKDIAANPGQTAQILDAMVQKQNALTEAIQRRYDASRTADAGVAQALSKYTEDATNFAKASESLVNHTLGGLEDGLTAMMSGQKFNWHKLIDDLIAETTRLYVIRPLLASLFGQGTAGGGALGGIFGSGGLAGAPGGQFGSGQMGAGGAMSLLGGSGGGLIGSLFNAGSSGLGTLFGAGSSTGGIGFGAGAGVFGAADLGVFLADGTNYVPYDGMQATLHKGEAVVPAAYNPAAGGKSTSNSVTINYTASAGEDKRTANQRAAHLGRTVRNAMARC